MPDLDPAIARRVADAVRLFGLLGASAETVQRVHRGQDIGDPLMQVAITRELQALSEDEKKGDEAK